MSSCVGHRLDANVAIRQGHRGAGVHNDVNIVALRDGIKGCLSHADVCFASIEYDVGSVHFRDNRLDTWLEHRKLLLICEDLHTTVMLVSDSL